MPDPTPGQMAYATYVAVVERRPVAAAVTMAMWHRLMPQEQRAWEAAAQAVRMQYKEEMADAWQSGQAVWTQRALDHPAQAELDAAPGGRKEP